MSRWFANFLCGRSFEGKQELDHEQIEALVKEHSEAKGKLEIEIDGLEIISAEQPLPILYSELRKELEDNVDLSANHEVYSGLGKEKHYLDIQANTRTARIIYELK